MAKSEFSCDCTTIHDDVVRRVAGDMLSADRFEKLTAFFKVLGDHTRLRILWALDQHEMCVCDLANVLGMTKSAVSHQLGYLRRVNLVKFRRAGKTVFYSPSDEHVRLMLESGLEHIIEEE